MAFGESRSVWSESRLLTVELNSAELMLSLAMVGCGVTDKVEDLLRLGGSLYPWDIELVENEK